MAPQIKHLSHDHNNDNDTTEDETSSSSTFGVADWTLPRDGPQLPHQQQHQQQQHQNAATPKHGRSPAQLIRAVPSEYPSPLPFHLVWLARILALIVPTLFYAGPFFLSLPITLLCLGSYKTAAAIFLLDVFLVYVPVQPWPRVRRVFQLWYELYDFHHNLLLQPSHDGANANNSATLSVEDDSLVTYATHPHGVIPIHGYLWCAFCDQHFPHRYGFGALTDIAMRLPLLRHLMSWLSSTSATKSTLMKRMMHNQDNLYILPGGVNEIFMACQGRHVIKTPRRGLMKLCLQTGSLLVPTYVFGASDFFRQLATFGMEKSIQNKNSSIPANNNNKRNNNDPTNWIGKIQKNISRSAKGGFTFFWGRYGLPLPYEKNHGGVKCCMVFGDPIEPTPGTLGYYHQENDSTMALKKKKTCQPIPEPTQEQIDDLQHRYIDALVRLFQQYKAEAGYPEAELVLK